MVDLAGASREDLLALIAAQQAQIEALLEQNAALTARVAELERRLGQNSRNSSLPPSTDRFDAGGKRRPRNSGKRPGKQPGAPGAGLAMVSDPDVVIDHVPQVCGGCGSDLPDADADADADGLGFVRRQVHDLPERIEAVVTEHRLRRARCGCGRVTTAPAPAGVGAHVQYGARLTALVAYLVVAQHVPYERAVTLIADLCPGLRPSPGWACTAVASTAAAVEPATAAIRKALRASPVLHVDETSTSIAGKRWWLHVASTATLTALHLHPSRGREAVADFGILPGYAGTAIHDAFSVYDVYPEARHGLCGAHLLRELAAAAEACPGQAWVPAAIDALSDLLAATHQARGAGAERVAPQVLEALLHRYSHAVRCGLAEHPAVAGRKQSKTRNLLTRMRERAGQILLFAHDLDVPFTNNQAERDLRPAKTQLKISGCHRSTSGARASLTIRAYVSTCRKNTITALAALHDALTGHPWMPAITA